MLKTTKSRRLFAEASRVLPGGVDSPVRAFTAVGGVPLFVQRASGATITDADGNRLLDYVMSWGPLIHGHAPRGLVAAITAAAKRGTSFGAPSALEHRLGTRVRELMPSMERVRFVSSGTEAAMSVARLARAFTKRNTIIKFEGCYHGHADTFLVKAGSGATTFGVPTSPGVPSSVTAETLVADYNDLTSVDALFAAHKRGIAAVIVEPIAGNMGVVPPADGFLQGLRERCARHGALLVFDEVISGFRAAAGGAQAVFGVRPDLTCLGKVIGGGLPVGACGGRAEIMDLVAPAGPVYQAGTLSGNPMAMTAGAWALGRLTPKLYRDLARRGTMLAAGFAAAAREAGVPLHVNGFGSLVTPFFTASPVRDYRSAVAADTTAYGTFFRGMLNRGIYPPPSQFEAWFLSAAHTDRDITKTIDAARGAMKDVVRAVGTRRPRATPASGRRR
jgi:glutamate-1-semialdehyde 2,1-aminomutase